MQIVNNIYLPDGDTHFARQIEKNPIVNGRGTYQYPKVTAALSFVDHFGHAVDIGAQVGLWSRILAPAFDHVSAFEPMPKFADCFDPNLFGHNNVTLSRIAIGDRCGVAKILQYDETIASAAIVPDDAGGIAVEMATLDSIPLGRVDFIKIDVDGREAMVLRGAKETIQRNKPVIAIEQKRRALNAPEEGYALDILQSWGAKIVFERGGDYCLMWGRA